MLARAYVDLVKAWGWDKFVILYEDNEGMSLWLIFLSQKYYN